RPIVVIKDVHPVQQPHANVQPESHNPQVETELETNIPLEDHIPETLAQLEVQVPETLTINPQMTDENHNNSPENALLPKYLEHQEEYKRKSIRKKLKKR
ncbi:MAG: hypothetical protein RR651_11890, partial [Lysinibacillus sp.]